MRNARLFDISVLGRHIGAGYLNVVDGVRLREAAREVADAAVGLVGDLYAARCVRCGNERATLSKTVWSVLLRCPGCAAPVSFYRCLEAAGWHKSKMVCPGCGQTITSKATRVGEERVLDSIECPCSKRQVDQPARPPAIEVDLAGLSWPDVEIPPDRQMYQASALGKHGLTTIASFYSDRNLAMLYYIAPVFYEWNVLDLFHRKVEAAIRSDRWILDRHAEQTGREVFASDVTYELTSAEAMPLPDGSVDYVFTDPPFGSNLFYADMALFQEGWLGSFTDHTLEVVIDRGARKRRDGDRYEQLLTAALRECRRILRPGGYTTMVFGNSSGAVWALVQRAVRAAGLVIEPGSVLILNRGQRSVKGLASGFENVATMDLIISMRERRRGDPREERTPQREEIEEAVTSILAEESADSPSHLYLELLRRGIADGWDLSSLDLRLVTDAVRARGWEIDPASGRLAQAAAAA